MSSSTAIEYLSRYSLQVLIFSTACRAAWHKALHSHCKGFKNCGLFTAIGAGFKLLECYWAFLEEYLRHPLRLLNDVAKTFVALLLKHLLNGWAMMRSNIFGIISSIKLVHLI
jgi:hypothetical protein